MTETPIAIYYIYDLSLSLDTVREQFSDAHVNSGPGQT